MDDKKKSFDQAAEAVKTLTHQPSNEHLLELYSLYKQGTVGDVSQSRPGMWKIKDRAKWDAWNSHKGMDAEAACSAYVALVDELTKPRF
jgi:acyl-CoA-binding protein